MIQHYYQIQLHNSTPSNKEVSALNMPYTTPPLPHNHTIYSAILHAQLNSLFSMIQYALCQSGLLSIRPNIGKRVQLCRTCPKSHFYQKTVYLAVNMGGINGVCIGASFLQVENWVAKCVQHPNLYTCRYEALIHIPLIITIFISSYWTCLASPPWLLQAHTH